MIFLMTFVKVEVTKFAHEHGTKPNQHINPASIRPFDNAQVTRCPNAEDYMTLV